VAPSLLAITLVHMVIACVARLRWQAWMLHTRFTTTHLPAQYRLGWGLGWPLDKFGMELLSAMAVGLGFGALFALLMRDRKMPFRVSVACWWALLVACFVIQTIFFLHLPAQWSLFAPGMKKTLLQQFILREFTCAGAFWIGTYLVRSRSARRLIG
jgi:hypothetical protein